MSRVERIVVVTLALVGAGAIAGGVVGAVALTVSILLTRGPFPLPGLIIGGVLGVVLGAFTAPIVAWLLLRRVPLGEMFTVCSTSAAIGGVIGWLFAVTAAPAMSGLAGAFLGCLIAAITLRQRAQYRLEA